MSQAKFINVFGQLVHPDFYLTISPIIPNSCTLHNFNGMASISFNDKTIDEVAEEYNRQVDKAVAEGSYNQQKHIKNIMMIKQQARMASQAIKEDSVARFRDEPDTYMYGE